MKKLSQGWQVALWCVGGTAVSAALVWLLSYAPWTESKEFRVGAAWVALVCSVLNLIYTMLKTPLKERPWIKRTMAVVNVIYWIAWVCYGATLL